LDGGNMNQTDTCSPGSHPHLDRPNWRPAETADEYFQNCREGLERYSERHLAKLLGMSRAELWRCRMIAALPDDLFEYLLSECGRRGIKLSSKAMAQISLALQTGNNVAECERCPHCRGVLRLRAQVSPALADVVNEWLGRWRVTVDTDDTVL
jgi:hypothetical protein